MLGQEPPIQRRSTTAVLLAGLSQVPGEVFAALAAADDDCVVLFRFGHHHLHSRSFPPQRLALVAPHSYECLAVKVFAALLAL